VSSLIIIIVQILIQAFDERISILCRPNVNILLFECPPKSFDINIVKSPASTVHAYCYSLSFKVLYPYWAGELRALVGVQYLRFSVFSNSLLKHLKTTFCTKCVRKAPPYNVTAVNVDNCSKVKEAMLHWDICNINTPNVIGMGYLQPPELIRMNVFCKSQLAQIPSWVDCHHAHLPQKSSYPLGTNQYAKCLYKVHHAKNSLSRMLKILLIHLAHHIKIFRILFNRFIVMSASVHTKKFTLSTDTEPFSRGYYFFEDFSIPSFSEALLQKSTSISNLPIFSYSACSRLWASSSGALVENISELRDRNSRFQVEIICGCIPKRFDSSLSVSCSLIASMATCALKAALCFFLLVFM
jgi:hypothetical protein